MKRIGMVIALGKEFDALEELLGNPEKKHSMLGIEFSEYRLGDKFFVVARCGIGEIYATMACSVLVVKYRVKALLNYGFAGALSDKYGIFDMVAVRDVVHYDMDLTAFGNALGQYDDRESEYWQADSALTAAILKERMIPSARIASADKFVRLTENKLALSKQFSADLCDMESAAVAIAAHKARIPFVSIKLIVDGIGGDSLLEFEENAKRGALCLAEIFYDFIKD